MIAAALTFVMSATGAQTPAPCETALVPAIKLPHVVAPVHAPTLAGELERAVAVTTSARDAFEIVERHVRPVMQNVAWFLQTRSNYPAAFESNDLAAQITRIHDELYARLQTLKTSRRPAAPTSRWSSWFGAPAPDSNLDVIVTEIRVLHFTLITLTEDLDARTKAARSLNDVIEDLLRATRTMHDVLDALIAFAETSTPDADLPLRLARLREDLQVQTHLVNGIDADLRQRVQAEDLVRAQIRRLLQVILPMEVVLAGADLDLSPLAPADVRAVEDEPGPIVAATAPLADLPVPVATAIEYSQKAHQPADGNALLSKYFNNALPLLKTNDVISLVKSLRDNQYYNQAEAHRDEYSRTFLTTFSMEHSHRLTVNDIATLVGVARHKDELILAYARAQAKRLSQAELLRLGAMIESHASRTEFMAIMGVK